MTFNIGSQSGGVFNNVAGNQHIHGGQQGTWRTPSRSSSRAAGRPRPATAVTGPGGRGARRDRRDRGGGAGRAGARTAAGPHRRWTG